MRSISLVLRYGIISSAAGALPASSISFTDAPSAILDVQEATFDNFLGGLPPPEVSKSAASQLAASSGSQSQVACGLFFCRWYAILQAWLRAVACSLRHRKRVVDDRGKLMGMLPELEAWLYPSRK